MSTLNHYSTISILLISVKNRIDCMKKVCIIAEYLLTYKQNAFHVPTLNNVKHCYLNKHMV